MARIAGVDLPASKKIKIALTSIYGIGRKTAVQVAESADISVGKRAGELSTEEINSLRRIIDKDCIVEGDLRREVSVNIKRWVDMGSYRGLRHRRRLPVRGQRTKTNARTRKGPRKTVAGKKKAPGSK